jgi:hypothetical protein
VVEQSGFEIDLERGHQPHAVDPGDLKDLTKIANDIEEADSPCSEKDLEACVKGVSFGHHPSAGAAIGLPDWQGFFELPG